MAQELRAWRGCQKAVSGVAFLQKLVPMQQRYCVNATRGQNVLNFGGCLPSRMVAASYVKTQWLNFIDAPNYDSPGLAELPLGRTAALSSGKLELKEKLFTFLPSSQ